MRQPERPAWATAPGRTHLFAYDATAGVEDRWCHETLSEFGRIDAIIPCAGIFVDRSVLQADDEQLDQMFEINVKAPRRLARSAWPALKASGSGRGILIASLSGKRVASARSGLYAMTKHAVVALAHALRHEGWDHGIRCTAVCPGFVETDMGRGLVPDASRELTHPDDVARLVSLALNLRNSASLAELCVNCSDGELY